jgi:hypothetical protein
VSSDRYEVVFHAKAATEVQGLPQRAGVALWEALVAISRAPWAETHPDRMIEDPGFRFALFDDGDGVVHVRVSDGDRVVVVHSVTWVG